MKEQAATEPAVEYPMHEKLKALGHDKVAVQNFIDWLFDKQEWWICEYGTDRGTREHLFTVRQSREQIMALFFKIDTRVLDDEKRAMLDHIRAQNERREKSGS